MKRGFRVVVIGRTRASGLRVCLQAIPFDACEGRLRRFGFHRRVRWELARRSAPTALRWTSPSLSRLREHACGVRALVEVLPAVEFVAVPGWRLRLQEPGLAEGVGLPHATPDVAVTCGRLRERDPPAAVGG